jgi:hypothetical protein
LNRLQAKYHRIMKKLFFLSIAYIFLVHHSFAQELLNVNGDHSQSVIKQYTKNNSDNSYWRFTFRDQNFDGRQQPEFFITDEEAFSGDRCLKVIVHELSSMPEEVWNVQIFNWTREDTILGKDRYYRCSIKIKPLGDHPLYSNIAVTDLSQSPTGYRFNNKMVPNQWNSVGIVVYNEHLDVLRMNNQFNHILNEPALPITFYLDDCRILESKLADARVEEGGDRVIIKSGWHLHRVSVNHEAFTVVADGDTIPVQSAEILEDSLSIQINLAGYIHQETNTTKISYNSALASLQYYVWPNALFNAPTKSMLSFKDEILENYSGIPAAANKAIAQESGIRVFPVPAYESITVGGLSQPSDLEVISITGQVIKTVHTCGGKTVQISLNDLSQGIYLLNIRNTSRRSEVIRFTKL